MPFNQVKAQIRRTQIIEPFSPRRPLVIKYTQGLNKTIVFFPTTLHPRIVNHLAFDQTMNHIHRHLPTHPIIPNPTAKHTIKGIQIIKRIKTIKRH